MPSIAELRQQLADSESRLNALMTEKHRIEQEIGELTGEHTPVAVKGEWGAGNGRVARPKKKAVQRPPKSRFKNERTLPQEIEDALGQHGPLGLGALVAIVLNRGYKTHSADFKSVVYQAIHKMKHVRYNKASGTYSIKVAKR